MFPSKALISDVVLGLGAEVRAKTVKQTAAVPQSFILHGNG